MKNLIAVLSAVGGATTGAIGSPRGGEVPPQLVVQERQQPIRGGLIAIAAASSPRVISLAFVASIRVLAEKKCTGVTPRRRG